MKSERPHNAFVRFWLTPLPSPRKPQVEQAPLTWDIWAGGIAWIVVMVAAGLLFLWTLSVL